ncbi:VIT and vWA domain-containing protein [Rariglobus hedericola]|uniref:VWA domain-containing protein n=1 Tax=Rariglobus hedericola TaxID=2597822 RepID=A0A556QQ74_9BACT|nr:VIT and VWA domain-containing protein [Rariglobus hedericola]TSJ78790.1 VWA domain-containing protein [Rariglobus hedericola]
MKTKSLILTGLLAFAAALTPAAFAGGTLTPVGSPHAPIQIRSHQVNVTINNGFAQTEVLQTFFNPNPTDLEALYVFPVPKSASLSEVTITSGEKTLNGEVLPKKEAETIYEEEKSKGNDAGLTTKNGYQNYEFKITPVRANAETQLRFVYYQPLEIDTGVGRYVYPLEEGGTDEVAKSFWQPAHSTVEGRFAINVTLKSAWPVADVRVPGFENATVTNKLDAGHYTLSLDRTGAKLDRDFVLYYRLADNLPGRVEVIPYRADKSKPGTFMMVVTPGIDLQPITSADYTYVLDVSGSMQGKIATLANGISQALGQMRPADRFRIITFNNNATEILGWTTATPENVANATTLVKAMQPNGGTNIYAGLQLALKNLDADRASSVVLVTDGVTNEGIVDPAKFHALLKQQDVRFFGFLMGNNANWPLMRAMGDATGGFYTGVSNSDDIVGQLLLAKSKIAFESLHDASFKFTGARVSETTGDLPQKIYRGQQLVIFGRYDGAGPATVSLKARLTGEDKTYTTTFNFPEVDTDNPEIERLWALAQIEQIELKEAIGQMPASESKDAIISLGVTYQLVTDHTAMLVLDDATHASRGIDRKNQQRTATERTAQSVRSSRPVKSYQVDAQQPTYSAPAPHVSHSGGGGGGGALDRKDIVMLAVIIGLVGGAYAGRQAMKRKSDKE